MLEILAIPLFIIGVLLAVFFVIFIIQLFMYGPREALDNIKEGLLETLINIWGIITLPFTIIKEIFMFIAKLFKR